MQHLDEGTIHAWLDGALSATEGADVEHHVAECAECRALVAEARGMIAGATRIVTALDVVRGGVIPKAASGARSSVSLWRSLRLTPARAALAATVLIAVSTLLAVRHDTLDKIVPMAAKPPAAVATSASPTPASSAPTPAAAAAAARAAEPSVPARDLADARARAIDSVSAAPSKKAAASAVQPLNSPAAQNAIAAASAAVPTAPPVSPSIASGAGISPSTMADARRTLAKANADSARSGAAGAPRFAPRPERVTQLSEVLDVAGSRASTTFTGCYQFTRDSVFGSNSLPERFALDSLRADTTLNVVRAVSADGRPDGVIAGSRWSQVSLNAINVRLARGGATQTLTMRFSPGSPVGVATINGETPSRTLTVTRLTCRP